MSGRWPTRVRSVTKPQERVLRRLARNLVKEGNPVASEPQALFGVAQRTLDYLVSCALIEQTAPDPTPEWALTWRGRGYLGLLDKQRRGERL